MSKDIGYRDSYPSIESVRFKKGYMMLYLSDGRILSVPLSRFPEINELTMTQKRKHSTLAGMGLMFDDIDEYVYHISDFLGGVKNTYDEIPEKEIKKVHSLVAEPRVKYNKSK